MDPLCKCLPCLFVKTALPLITGFQNTPGTLNGKYLVEVKFIQFSLEKLEMTFLSYYTFINIYVAFMRNN